MMRRDACQSLWDRRRRSESQEAELGGAQLGSLTIHVKLAVRRDSRSGTDMSMLL
jgi:hypothetical protein